jgi:glucose-1-phosphate adenylyltransferase
MVALLLAGGMGHRLNILVRDRAKPAVPFAGRYRIIDFTLNNIAHSDIQQVGILTQYLPESLTKYIGNGKAWGFNGHNRQITILSSTNGSNPANQYYGTADAVLKNLDYLKQFHTDDVIVLSGDHVYRMDYNQMFAFHRKKKADVTIAMKKVPWKDISNYGIATIDNEQRVIDWQEKPEQARSNLASMGIYIFDLQFLEKALSNRNGHDFGQNIIKDAYPEHRVYGHLFDGYWADVGTLPSYWKTNMDVIRPKSGLRLNDWRVRTNLDEERLFKHRPTVSISKSAKVTNSFFSDGCVVEGTVIRSVLSPGVCIKKGARIINSIIMHDSTVESNSCLFDVVADQQIHVRAGAQIGFGAGNKPNERYPDNVFTGLTIIGKNAIIPANLRIYRNTIIEPFVNEESFEQQRLKVGSYIER